MTCRLSQPDEGKTSHFYVLQLAEWIALVCCLLLPAACGGSGSAEKPGISSDSRENPPFSAAASDPSGATDQVQLRREIKRSAPNRLEVTVHVKYGGNQPVTALGLVENLPPGWAFGQISGAHPPQIAPAPGQTDRLEFVWITTPPFPFALTYSLEQTTDHPENTGPIRGQAVYRRLGGEEHSPETATSIPEVAPAMQ